MSGPSQRLGWWKGLTAGEIVFTLVAFLLVAVAAWSRKVEHHFFGSVIGSILSVAAILAGVLALFLLRLYMRRVVIESACPCCGAVARRAFHSAGTRFALACGSCVAYLRLAGDQVIEESLDEVDNVDYEVPPTRYLPAARRDNRSSFEFRMPPICASCGSYEAASRRRIGNWNAAKTDFGALGLAVSIVADVTDVPSFSAHDYGAMGTRAQDRDHKEPTAQQRLDRALDDIEVPVCAKHVKDGLDPLRYDSGKLEFRSYRYYREFLKLNRIDGATESR